MKEVKTSSNRKSSFNECEESLAKREALKKLEEFEEMDKISLAQRTLMTRLYVLEQEMEVFKDTFPEEYSYFSKEIEKYRETYASNLEEIRNRITFEIDPELNTRMHGRISRLEQAIQKFLAHEVRFDILSKRLQNLITKLNILYNVSIFHPKEKEKVISQVERAISVEMEVVQELKTCESILADSQYKERLVTLISYVDYHIFKIILRNTSLLPQQVFEKLVLLVEFKDFDCFLAFKAFIEDELSDLRDLLVEMNDEAYFRIFDKKIGVLLEEITCAAEVKEKLLKEDFWHRIFEVESSLLLFLKEHSKLEKERMKVTLISNMQIAIKENEVLTLPKTNAYLTLLNIFSTTYDERVWLLMKLFQNVSSEVTYKGIYFLFLLFDVLDLAQTIPNSLTPYLQKYITKYSYDTQAIQKKKQYVLASNQAKHYRKILSLDEEADKMIAILRKLNIDFQVNNGSIEMNTFYLNGFSKIFVDNL